MSWLEAYFFSSSAMLWDCYIFTIVLRDRLAFWFLFKDQMERSELSNILRCKVNKADMIFKFFNN